MNFFTYIPLRYSIYSNKQYTDYVYSYSLLFRPIKNTISKQDLFWRRHWRSLFSDRRYTTKVK